MLRRFSGLSCGKYCFYSLIFAFIISLGCINTANAYVCFLPDSSDCAKGDTEGFWPCVGSDCDGGENGKCDASYNSNRSTNECGATCTRCSDSTSPYNGLYKCPENTCNCNEYTSAEAFNECGESCKVCRISGDANYGKYKCPAVPASGCPNPQCEGYTLTKPQADNITANGGVCDQCTNLNAPANRQNLYKCENCDPDIYTKTLEGCAAEGYDSAKNKCGNGDVYQACCNTCNGHIYTTDLSKTSDGWECGPACTNSCDGGSKWSCSCKTGYHPEGGNCVLNQCTSGVAENTCDTANGYTFTATGTPFKNTNGETVKCGECTAPQNNCSTWAIWFVEDLLKNANVSGAEDVTEQLKDINEDAKFYKSCLNEDVTFSVSLGECANIYGSWEVNGNPISDSNVTSVSFKLTQDFINQHQIYTISNSDNYDMSVNYYNNVELYYYSYGMPLSSCYGGTEQCVENPNHRGCYNECYTKSYCENHLRNGEECVVSGTKYGRDCYKAQQSNIATIYCDYYEQKYDNAHETCYGDIFSNSTIAFDPCEINYTVKAGNTTICSGAKDTDSRGLVSTTIPAGTYELKVDYSGYLGSSRWVNCSNIGCDTKCYRKYAPDILVVYDNDPTNSFQCWQIGRREFGYHSPCSGGEGRCYMDSVTIENEMSYNNYNSTSVEQRIFDDYIAPNNDKTVNCPVTYSDYNLPSYTFQGGKTYYIRAGSVYEANSIHKCWYEDPF